MRPRLVFAVLGVLCACALVLPAVAAAEFGPISSFSSSGEGAGQIREPGNAEYAPDGNFYLADYGNNRVDVFSPSGSFLFAFGAKVNATDESDVCTTASGCVAGSSEDGAGGMFHPEDVSIFEGVVYVADSGLNRIDAFEEDGTFVEAFGRGVNAEDGSDICDEASGCIAGLPSGEEAGMKVPTGITAAGNYLVVADSENNRIDYFEPDGVFIAAVGQEVGGIGDDLCGPIPGTSCQSGVAGSEAGAMNGPRGITTTMEDAVAVVDSRNGRIDIYFGPEFEFAFGAGVGPEGSGTCSAETGCEEGALGSGAGAIASGTVITTDAAGNYYVGDSGLDRVSEFGEGGTFLRAFGEGVVNGAKAFQVCTTSCQEGIEGTIAGSTPNPYGLAIDSSGRLSVVEESGDMTSQFARVENFGQVSTSTTGGGSTTTTPAPTTPAKTLPSGKFKVGRVVLNKKNGTATLTVTPVSTGRFVLSGKGVKKASAAGSAGRATKLKVRTTGETRKALAKTGRARVKLKITFTPTGGKATTRTKTLLLLKKLG